MCVHERLLWAAAVMVATLVGAAPAGAQIAGATYKGTLASGQGLVRIEVSPDGTMVSSFSVDVSLGEACGEFSTSGAGGDPIVGHAFSHSEEGDSLSYGGTFSDGLAQGTVSYSSPFDPSCSFSQGWTVGVLRTLTVVPAGGGSGSVESKPYGIYCGGGSSTCSAQLAGTVTLTAKAAFRSYFAGWSGSGCSGTGTCTVAMDADRSVTATFRPWKLTLTRHPAKRTRSRTARFGFTSSWAGSRFRCSLDGRAGRCTSPKTYRHLARGPHMFELQATGPSGSTYGPTVLFNWTVR